MYLNLKLSFIKNLLLEFDFIPQSIQIISVILHPVIFKNENIITLFKTS